MNKVRRVDFYADEFIAGVVGQLDDRELSVYWLICSLIYSRGGPIPDDPQWIARIYRNGNPRSVRAIIDRLVAMSKVSRSNGELMVKRCRTELDKTANRISKASENGSKGGRPRKENNDIEEPDGFRDEKLTTNQQPATTNQQPSSVSKDTGAARREASPHVNGTTVEFPKPPPPRTHDAAGRVSSGDPRIDDLFWEVWNAYPHRSGKGRGARAVALKNYAKLLGSGYDPAEILADVKSFAADPKHRQFWGNANDWLWSWQEQKEKQK
jgi:uncharacterized protein YdaU (DUF1376 family)